MVGDVFHITLNCRERRPLLRSDEARRTLAAAIDRGCRRCDARLLAFVFMPEHAHLLVEAASRTFDPTALIGDVVGCHERRLFERREGAADVDPAVWDLPSSRAAPVTGVAAALEAMRAIHGNPVARGLCGSPGDWSWSSYRGSRGLDPGAEGLPRVAAPSWQSSSR